MSMYCYKNTCRCIQRWMRTTKTVCWLWIFVRNMGKDVFVHDLSHFCVQYAICFQQLICQIFDVNNHWACMCRSTRSGSDLLSMSELLPGLLLTVIPTCLHVEVYLYLIVYKIMQERLSVSNCSLCTLPDTDRTRQSTIHVTLLNELSPCDPCILWWNKDDSFYHNGSLLSGRESRSSH